MVGEGKLKLCLKLARQHLAYILANVHLNMPCGYLRDYHSYECKTYMAKVR